MDRPWTPSTDVEDLIRGMAKKMAPHHQAEQDLVQVGLLAAWQSEAEYRPGSGAKLSTYLYPAVHGAMVDELTTYHTSSGVPVPPSQLSRMRTAGGDPVPGLLSDVTVRALKDGQRVADSPDAAVVEGMEMADFHAQLQAPSAEAEAMVEVDVDTLLEGLTERQRTVVTLKHLSGLTAQGVADRLGLDRATVTRDLTKAMTTMKGAAHAAV